MSITYLISTVLFHLNLLPLILVSVSRGQINLEDAAPLRLHVLFVLHVLFGRIVDCLLDLLAGRPP